MSAAGFTKRFARLPSGWSFRFANDMDIKLASTFSMDSLYLVVPDIHGTPDKAQAVIEILERLRVSRVVFLGDYIDRMPGSVAVAKLIKVASKRNPSWIFLRGNHEQMFIDSYTERMGTTTENTLYSLSDWSEREAYAALFESMPVFLSTEHLLFVHGGIHESYLETDIVNVPNQELLWTYGVHPWYRGKKIVRGHDPVIQPTERQNNIALETCGWRNGGLFTVGVIADLEIENNLIGWLELKLE